ncbi:MAG: chorismate-binding protein [Firmicutes bacterium]|nr:chorismate-binding protein [Alicyclobacillaceae bacterium]MCL6496420.1 chorismate-binding protein [Bacillota bacterium]
MTVWQGSEAPRMAVVATLAVDHLTPIGAFVRLRPLGAHTLLESVEGDEKVARYSFIAVGEWARLVEEEGQAVLRADGSVLDVDPNPVAVLRRAQDRFRVAVPSAVELPFPGGAVGYFAYDWVRWLERLPRHHRQRGPLWEWVWPKAVVAFDHRQKTVTVIAEGDADEPAPARALAEAMVQQMQAPWPVLPPKARRVGPIVANVSRERYLEMVAQAQRYILAGDIFQVVLSQRLWAPIAGDAFDLYRRLRRVNPSPYLFYLETPRVTLVGSSPEALIRVQNGWAINRPIAGTRRRGRTEAEDRALWDELIADPKERAEHTMLVDLARNDLGRVCRYGSVEVTHLMERESYSHVMHIVSEVRGQLQPELDSLDALAAVFPAGTLTGAPKIRAMEVIEELEPEARAAYGGVVGYLSHRGDLDACITIRTIEVRDHQASVQAGGGVVADSRPEAEFQESLNKAAAGLTVLEAEGEPWL